MAGQIRDSAFDHVVAVMFENRSFDNLLGRLYQPGEVTSFDGVTGKDLSNPVPEWAQDGAERGTVPYGVARDMNTPDPDRARSTSTSTPSCSASSTLRATAASRPRRWLPRITRPATPGSGLPWTVS
jgi:phospholipase C